MSFPAIYVYKCVNDDGTAPCVDDGLFSLTICKPAIRRTAEEGNFIFAFRGNNQEPPNGLVYIAEVAERIPDGRYFTLRKYRSRQDCIYRFRGSGELVHRRDKPAHSAHDHRFNDVGQFPHYKRAVALISTNFRYFGDSSNNNWKRKHPHLRRIVERLTQNHLKPAGVAVRDELLSLKAAVWEDYPRRKVIGEPAHIAETLPPRCGGDPVQARRDRCSTVESDE